MRPPDLADDFAQVLPPPHQQIGLPIRQIYREEIRPSLGIGSAVTHRIVTFQWQRWASFFSPAYTVWSPPALLGNRHHHTCHNEQHEPNQRPLRDSQA